MTGSLVVISQRRDPTGPPHNEIRDALDSRLAAFVIAAGGLPVPVPSALVAADSGAWLQRVRPDAVLLSGGSDIGTDAVRDRLDLTLIAYAQTHRLPLLGICRGMQILAHAAGATLKALGDHVATRHQISGEIAREVNSYHALVPAAVPDGYRILARAEDGAIEAIAHETLPWEGWMWHPEREETFDPRDIDRLERILA